jgi:hypothetical protein
MLQVPAGHYEVDPSILPRGMSSYVKSLVKQNMDFQTVGAYVNGKSLTCLIEGGKLLCVTENKCFMKKILGSNDEFHVDMNVEINSVRNPLDPMLLATIFTSEDERGVIFDEEPGPIMAKGEDCRSWSYDDKPLSIDEMEISFMGHDGQMDSTKPTVLHELDILMEEDYTDGMTSKLWETMIPDADRINLYNFMQRISPGVAIFILARRKPIMTILGSSETIWDRNGKAMKKFELVTLPPSYKGRFPDGNLIPPSGPVRWLMMSCYYLLYWVFKMIENNLGREFDGRIKDSDRESSFIITQTWTPS